MKGVAVIMDTTSDMGDEILVDTVPNDIEAPAVLAGSNEAS